MDNGIERYLIEDESVLDRFPGMDHLYLRLAWSFLEPEEGHFDGSYIDKIVEKYVPKGLKISFRITSKETGKAPTIVAQEVDGVMIPSTLKSWTTFNGLSPIGMTGNLGSHSLIVSQ